MKTGRSAGGGEKYGWVKTNEQGRVSSGERRRAADADRWRGLALHGVDGSMLKVADTVDNEEAFGRPGSRFDPAGYPQVMLVVLMALRSHLVCATAVGGCTGKGTQE